MESSEPDTGVCSGREGGAARMQQRLMCKLAKNKPVSLFSALIPLEGTPGDTWLEKDSPSSLRVLVVSSTSPSSAPGAST